MVQYTSRGYPYPESGDSVAPQSRDLVNLATAIDADVSIIEDKREPVVLTAEDNTDTLDPNLYLVTNVIIARALELPWEYPCSISVSPVSTGGGVTYTAVTAEQPPRQFLRSRLNNGTLSEWSEVAMSSGDTSGDSSGPVRRELLVQGLTARKGGSIGTGGRGVVALRFDDAPAPFVDTVLPMLRERGLPFTRVSTSDSVATQSLEITDAILAEMQDYCLRDGGEVWNHGRDHIDASGDAAIYDNLIGALDRLREHMPRLPIDCFAPPGGGNISYDGHMPSNTVANFADTYAGRLLVANHALVSGYFQNTYYKPLDGTPRDGQIHYSVDAYTATRANELIDRARDWGTGVCLMWHSNNIGTDGRMTWADFEATLDYLVEQRDAGNVVVLTKSGMACADIASDYRDDLLFTHSGSGSFSQAIRYPQYRQNALGSTRELVATVTGEPGAVVTSTVGEFSREHTIPASGTLNLRHVTTVPMDATQLAVSIDATAEDVHLYAV